MLATYSIVISSARSLRALLHKGYSPSKLSPSLPRLPLELQKQLLVLHIWRHSHDLGEAVLYQPRVHKGAVLLIDVSQEPPVLVPLLHLGSQVDGASDGGLLGD